MRTALAVASTLAVLASSLQGQERLPADLLPVPRIGAPPVTVVVGARYEAGEVHRFLFGDRHRDVWTAPIDVPVLDPGTFRGGLRPVRRGGGYQTLTLHMRDAAGRYYLFRSIDKRIDEALPEDLRRTPVGRILQDQTSALHPGAAWVVAPLLDAVGVPHSAPRLFVMPDHPVLGEEHRDFAGRAGILVESPDHGPDGNLRFLGSTRALSSEDWLAEVRRGPENRWDAETVLKARLVDLLVGDPDRGFRQWRWIRYGRPGHWTWRGVPMDRDAAFIIGDGLIGLVGRRFTPKFVRFGGEIEVEFLVENEPELDRLLLAELDRRAWDSLTAAVRGALTDSVLEAAVRAMPPGYTAADDGFLLRGLRARRDALPEAAREFYALLARDVDVRGTDDDDRAVVGILPDGGVEVTLYGPGGPTRVAGQDAPGRAGTGPYFHRRFVPDETREVRVYLQDGRDHAEVRGGTSAITVRIVGGPGDDTLIDARDPSVAGGPVVFYDHEGDDTVDAGPRTRVERSAWDRPTVTAYREVEGEETFRDYGPPESDWTFGADYQDAAGPVLDVRRRRTGYGFRMAPWAWRLDLSAAIGTGNGGLGAGLRHVRRVRGSSTAVFLVARASMDLIETRFHGFGNDSPRLDEDLELVVGDELRFEAGVDVAPEEPTGISAAAVLGWIDWSPATGSPFLLADPPAAGGFGQVGGLLRGRLRAGGAPEDGRPGLSARARTSVFAPVWDAPAWFGDARVDLEATLPLGSTLLALRGGAHGSWGDAPVHAMPRLGGRRSLRGFRHDRFAGDAAAHGGTEWRIPLFRLTLLTRGDFGVLGLADAGRVWFAGESPGGWHRSWGGGIWYRTLGVTGSATWAEGEEGRLYLSVGAAF